MIHVIGAPVLSCRRAPREGNPRDVLHAIRMDPLTSAVWNKLVFFTKAWDN